MSLTVIRAGAPIAETPVGAIQGYAGSSAPAGWLLCDGTAVSRTSYAELFGVIGTTYGSGDGSTTFNLPNTTGYIIYATRLATRVTVNQPPQYVTALPASPTDAQEIYYQAGSSGEVWHLRYRGSSSSSYKWEFVGGAPLHSAIDTSETLATTNTVSDLATTGPSVTAPVAGDYIVHWSARATTPGSNTDISVWLAKNGTSINYQGASGIPNAPTTAFQQDRFTLAASDVLRVRYYTNVANAAFALRRISLTPVRVG